MPSFRFKAVDPLGRIVEGEMSALSRALLISDLQARSCLPVSIVEAGRPAGGFGFGRKRPSGEDVTGLTEDLAALLAAGVPLAAALDLLRMSASPALSDLVSSLHDDVSGGGSFAEALAKSPLFAPGYVEMVRVSEIAGTLVGTLETLARERRRSAEIRRRVFSALAYPVFLVATACAVLAFVLGSVIPSFEQALSGLGSGAANGFVFSLSRAARENGTLMVAALACFLPLSAALFRARSARRAARHLFARLPVLRTLVAYHRTLVFCGTLAMLLRSGVEISVSVRLIRDMMREGDDGPSPHDEFLASLRNGEHLTASLAKVDLLPLQAVHMLKVGEETGDLAGAAARVAAAYDAKFARALDRATGMLGPVILLLVSALVAWIIVSVMTALLQINEALL